MDATIHGLSRILLNAVPTFLILLILVAYMRWIFFGPLARILKQRYDETEGARKAAEESMKMADARFAEYEEKLRAARVELHSAQERALREIDTQNGEQIARIRREAELEVARAKESIAEETEEARRSLAAKGDELAEVIVRRVLPGVAA